MDQRQLMQSNAYIAEQERNAQDAAKRRQREEKKQAAYNAAHPDEAAFWGWMTFIGFVLVGLLVLWAYYGPIIRDAIYGA